MVSGPFREAPSSRVLRTWWAVVHEFQQAYPLCPVPSIRLSDDQEPVEVDLEGWTLRISMAAHVDCRQAICEGLATLVCWHLRGKLMSKRHKLYRQVLNSLTA